MCCVYLTYIRPSCCQSWCDKDCFHYLTAALHLPAVRVMSLGRYILYMYVRTNVHHQAVGRDATKTASITWLLLSINHSAVRVMSMSRSLCLSTSGFSWWYPWTGDEGALSFCDQKTVESREPALLACLVTSSWYVQSTGDSFWYEDLP